MNIVEAVRAVKNETGWTEVEFAHQMGMTPQAIHNKIYKAKKDMRVGLAVRLLEMMGYKLVVMPANIKTPNGGMVVDWWAEHGNSPKEGE